MKTWKWIILGAGIVGLLAVRGVYLQINRVNIERRWYISQLNYDFSAQLDSVVIFDSKRSNGIIYYHVTRGEPNFLVEKRLNKSLKHNDNLRFIRANGANYRMPVPSAKRFMTGDSLVIQTNENHIVILRDKKVIAEGPAEPVLGGRPF